MKVQNVKFLRGCCILLLWASTVHGHDSDSGIPHVSLDREFVAVTPGCAFWGPPVCQDPLFTTFVLTYTVPEAGMKAGGGIGVSLGNVLDGLYRRSSRVRWGNLQNSRPQSPQYVTAVTSAPDVGLQTFVLNTQDRVKWSTEFESLQFESSVRGSCWMAR